MFPYLARARVNIVLWLNNVQGKSDEKHTTCNQVVLPDGAVRPVDEMALSKAGTEGKDGRSRCTEVRLVGRAVWCLLRERSGDG